MQKVGDIIHHRQRDDFRDGDHQEYVKDGMSQIFLVGGAADLIGCRTGLRGTLTGLAQPTYVLDIPGGHGKVPIGPCYLREEEDGAYAVTDLKGRIHRYEDSV